MLFVCCKNGTFSRIVISEVTDEGLIWIGAAGVLLGRVIVVVIILIL